MSNRQVAAVAIVVGCAVLGVMAQTSSAKSSLDQIGEAIEIYTSSEPAEILDGDCPCPRVTGVSPDVVCVNKSTRFTLTIDPHGYSEIRLDQWTVDNGTVSNATIDGADVVFTETGTQYHHIKISGKRVVCGTVYWDSVGVQDFPVTVSKVEKVEVSPKKVEVPVGETKDFAAKLIWFGPDGIEGTSDDMDVTQYCSDTVQWSTSGQGREDIGTVSPTTGSTTTFTAREELPAGKTKLTGHVIATSGSVSGQAVVTVVYWELRLAMRIVGSRHTRWEEVEEKVIELGKTAQFKATVSRRQWRYSFTWDGAEEIASTRSSSTAEKKFDAAGEYEVKVTARPIDYPRWRRVKTIKVTVIEVEITSYPASKNHLASDMNIEYKISPTTDFTADSAKLQVIDGSNVVVHTNTTIDKTGGTHSVNWNGKDTAGNWVNPGSYTLKVTIEKGTVPCSDEKASKVLVVWQPGGSVLFGAHDHDTADWETWLKTLGNIIGQDGEATNAASICEAKLWDMCRKYFGMKSGEWWCGRLYPKYWREIRHNDDPSAQERFHLKAIGGREEGWRYDMIQEKESATAANWNAAKAGGEAAITTWYNTYMIEGFETVTIEENTIWMDY